MIKFALQRFRSMIEVSIILILLVNVGYILAQLTHIETKTIDLFLIKVFKTESNFALFIINVFVLYDLVKAPKQQNKQCKTIFYNMNFLIIAVAICLTASIISIVQNDLMFIVYIASIAIIYFLVRFNSLITTIICALSGEKGG